MANFDPFVDADPDASGDNNKNDIAVVFGVACWIYSLVRFKRSRNKFFLFTAALCIAFIVGSKNLGLGIFVIAAVATTVGGSNSVSV